MVEFVLGSGLDLLYIREIFVRVCVSLNMNDSGWSVTRTKILRGKLNVIGRNDYCVVI
jgi:hypothetical protein